MSARGGYSTSQITLHWLIAVLVVFNYFYSEGMGDALDAKLDGEPIPSLGIIPNVHVWVGVGVLSLVMLRLAVRLFRGVPSASGERAIRLIAEGMHLLLYLLLFTVPILGAITWFTPLDATGDLHAICANGLLIAAGVHAFAAIIHQLVFRDGVLLKMLRTGI